MQDLVGITWEECAQLPYCHGGGQSTVIDGKVYCGGGGTGGDRRSEYIVYCYDPSRDNWTTLPPLSVKYFGLGQINGKLVAVGGKKSDHSRSQEAYSYHEERPIAKRWKQTIPPMPTARDNPGTLSLQSALLVAGGNTDEAGVGYTDEGREVVEFRRTDAVEIFKLDTMQWYNTDPLPTPCGEVSLSSVIYVMHWEVMVRLTHASIKHAMPQLSISFRMLDLPTSPVVVILISQLGRE